MILCPFHGETKPSMRIYPDHYYCFGCDACGDHVDWLVQVEGLEYDQARDIVDNWDGPVIPRSQTRDAEEDARRTAYALTWWDAAKPITGTLAARYLARDHAASISTLCRTISTMPCASTRHCVFGPGTRHPCLLALMRNPISDAPTGIQRIALTPDAQKIDRMMLGPAGVVQLWPAGKQLVIGEGLETTLAAATRLDYRGEPLRPAWAALSDGAMERFPVIDGVERLILLADNDHNNAGQIAAEACKRRWLEAGRRVALLMPDRPGTDFNDIVLDRSGARTMSGFTAEEFEPDAAQATAPTTPREAPTAKPATPHAPAATVTTPSPWPVLDAAAYHGLAGEVVCTMAPQTEADPVALLLQLLVYCGNAIGRGPYYQVGKDKHFTNLFGCWWATRQGAQGPLGRTHPRHLSRRSIPSGLSTASEAA